LKPVLKWQVPKHNVPKNPPYPLYKRGETGLEFWSLYFESAGGGLGFVIWDLIGCPLPEEDQ
jgi:hypothetical protein